VFANCSKAESLRESVTEQAIGRYPLRVAPCTRIERPRTARTGRGLRTQVETLRAELEEAHAANRENRCIITALTQRIPELRPQVSRLRLKGRQETQRRSRKSRRGERPDRLLEAFRTAQSASRGGGCSDSSEQTKRGSQDGGDRVVQR
jgi:hypothetical protein